MSAAAGAPPGLPARARTPFAGPRRGARATPAPHLDPAAPAGSFAPAAPEGAAPAATLRLSLSQPSLSQPSLSRPGRPQPSRPAPSRSPAP